MPAESGEPKDIRFSIRLEADTESKLQKFCEAHRMTRAEAIRKGIHLLLAEDK
ncbi:MAG: ribbon-helix-helix protein, CopG family [Acutalibacter sp.]|jgi:predicted transcriptional regulator|nr:ribbon-helix-helix protein, CopG family [Acutalibacter sp.]